MDKEISFSKTAEQMNVRLAMKVLFASLINYDFTC